MSAQPNLLVGERVLWTGKPFQGFLFTSKDIFLVPFSLFWASFAVFWTFTAWKSGAPIAFRLFGLPFVVAGFYVTAGRFLLDLLTRKHLTYFVTDKRILIAKGKSLESQDIKRLPILHLNERTDGTGTIRFGASDALSSGRGFQSWSPSTSNTPQFIRIENARTVYELIERTSR